MNALLFHIHGLGDWVNFTPVIAGLKRQEPDCRVDLLLGNPGVFPLVRRYPEVQAVHIFDLGKGFHRAILACIAEITRKYDLLFFSPGIGSEKANLVAPLLRADQKVLLVNHPQHPRFVSTTLPYDHDVTKAANSRRMLEAVGIAGDGLHPYLPFSGNAKVKSESVLIHAGSDAHRTIKRWPIEKYIELAALLLDLGKDVSFVFGPSEMDLLNSVKAALQDRIGLHYGQTLDEMITLIAGHETLINNDTGLGHIAAALGRAVVSIFGPADEVEFAPEGDNVRIVVAEESPDCRPCIAGKRKHRCVDRKYRCDDRKCLMRISPEAVLKVIT